MQGLVGKPKGKKLLGRPRSRRNSDIKINLNYTACEDVDWIIIVLDRNESTAPLNTVTCLGIA